MGKVIKKTIKDYIELALKKGGKYVNTTIPRYTIIPTDGWICQFGHQFKMDFHNIKQGHWCSECSGNRKRTLEDYKKLAIENGFTYILDYIPKNVEVSIDGWECLNKHIKRACYDNIQQGNKCTKCPNSRAYTIPDYINIAIENDFTYILDYIPENTSINIKGWVCPEGHICDKSYHSIKKGIGCRECSINNPKSVVDYKKAAEENGFIYILDYIPEYTTISIMGWKCPKDHLWTTSYRNIAHRHSGCHYCISYKSEELCRKYMEEALVEPFAKQRPNWLKYDKGYNLELDGYNEELQIAFEYQGKQHYEENTHFHREDGDFERQKIKDKWKQEQCKKRGVFLLKIPYTYSYLNPDKLRNFIYDNLFYMDEPIL